MVRKHLISTILLSYLASGLLFAFWAFASWKSSSPLIAQAAVLGASTETESTATPRAEKPYYSLTSDKVPPINAEAYIVYAPESGQVLLSSGNENTPRPIASITKQMTALLAVENTKLDDIVVVPQEATIQVDASLAGLVTGQHITIQELLYGLLLPSGNDAADTLAWQIGGSGHPTDTYDQRIARFVEMMNTKAKELGMQNTVYQDPAGFNDKGYSTPLDQVKLNAVILKQPVLAQVIATPNHGTWVNSNRFLNEFAYSGALGGKTGYTIAAGHSLVTAAVRNGVTLIVGGFHSDSDDNGESIANADRTLLDFVFSNLRQL